jgi:hypothetical protein
MSEKVWQPIKVCFCEHVSQDVAFEAEVVFPADLLPDQAPRVIAHRCSHGMQCNQDGRPSCIWAGTNPLVNPFES